MKEFEFIYCIRDGFQFHSDDEILTSEVVRAENKILAEESFLDILKDRGVDVMMVNLVSVEEIPTPEEEMVLEEEEEFYGEKADDYE